MAFEFLTDAFTGAPARRAAEQTRGYLGGVQQQGTGVINAGKTAGLAALGQGYQTGTGAINTGTDQALGYTGQALGAYQPLAGLGQKYGGATDLALGALGVGGPEQMAAARGAFQAGPGYDFTLNQGLESINRARNARGMANSGNTDREAQEYGSGLASKEYGSWLDRLIGFTSPELAATSGAATGQAGVYGQQANISSQRGQMLADLASKYGQNVAGVESGAAGQQVGLSTGLASPYAQTYGQEAAAQQQGSGNLWGLGMGLAGLGTNIYGAQQGQQALQAILGRRA